MKTIVIGDIHGCYKELKKMILDLRRSGEYNKDTDRLIFLGDYIDRGENSRLVINYIKRLQKENKNVIALMGNHEDMLLNYHEYNDKNWTFNGSKETIESYKGYPKEFKQDIKWMENLPLYYEDEHFIYVHAGIDVNKAMEEQDRNTLLWVRESFIYNEKGYDKKIIFGHTPTLSLNGMDKPVYTISDNIAMDTGCVYDGALTALIIEDDKIEGYYQIKKETEKSVIESKEEINI